MCNPKSIRAGLTPFYSIFVYKIEIGVENKKIKN